MSGLAALSIIEAMDSPDIWKPWFKRPAQWLSWRTFLRALFGLPLTPRDSEVFQRCTGRTADRSGQGFVEAWMVIGRRGGKSFILALVACYLACFRDWRPFLAPGERGTIPIVCVDRKQARTVFRYCRALLGQVTALAPLVERADHDTIDLSNGISIEIMTASYRSIRGYTVPAALCDEIAFWRTDETAANPDTEILDALRPAMATIPGAMLLVASSPYARRGALYEADRKHYGQEGDPVLVWKCDTLAMHDDAQVRAVIARAFDGDAVKAASEYGHDGTIDFRSDLETFVSADAVNAVVIPGRRELPRVAGIRYVAATDPSGSGSDAMTLSIAHRDKDGNVILDAIRERKPPFSPEAVVGEFATVCKAYGVTKIVGDHWGGEFVREPFRKHGIAYELAEKPKSDFYSELLPIINSARVELLDHPRFISQLCALERRTARSGKDSIDHPPGGHDDVVNVVAIACVLAAAKVASMILSPTALRKLSTMAPRQRFGGALGPAPGPRRGQWQRSP